MPTKPLQSQGSKLEAWLRNLKTADNKALVVEYRRVLGLAEGVPAKPVMLAAVRDEFERRIIKVDIK